MLVIVDVPIKLNLSLPLKRFAGQPAGKVYSMVEFAGTDKVMFGGLAVEYWAEI